MTRSTAWSLMESIGFMLLSQVAGQTNIVPLHTNNLVVARHVLGRGGDLRLGIMKHFFSIINYFII